MYNMFNIEQIDKPTPESYSSTSNKRTRVIKQTDFFFLSKHVLWLSRGREY